MIVLPERPRKQINTNVGQGTHVELLAIDVEKVDEPDGEGGTTAKVDP